MLTMKGVGVGLILSGVIMGFKSASTGGFVGAGGVVLAILAMLLGVALIEKATPKP